MLFRESCSLISQTIASFDGVPTRKDFAVLDPHQRNHIEAMVSLKGSMVSASKSVDSGCPDSTWLTGDDNARYVPR